MNMQKFKTAGLILLGVLLCAFPVPPAKASTSVTYSASAQFSGNQGQNGWFYQEWDGSHYNDLAFDAANNDWYGPSAYGTIRIYPTSVHPGTNHVDVVSKWMAPDDGTIRITALIRKLTASISDGVNAKIKHNASELFSAYIAGDNTAGVPVDLTLPINGGDAIYFITDMNENASYDTTRWDEMIQFTPAVHVRDFGAYPDDGMDDTAAIRSAIQFAVANGSEVVSFEAGRYDLKTNDGTPYISVSNASHLRLHGQLDPTTGIPTTRLVRANTVGDGGSLPALLSITNASNIAIENLALDNDPFYYTAGVVTAVSGDDVTIDMFAGHPRRDGMKPYIMGVYDLNVQKNKKLRITWDSNLPTWHTITGGSGRLMQITYANLASNVSVGDGVFWFQGNHGGAQVNTQSANDIAMTNVRTYNATGFAYKFQEVHNLTLDTVTLEPIDNRIAVVPRDGIHMQYVTGNVVVNNVTVQNVPGDDGLNIHSQYMAVQSVSGNTVTATVSGASSAPLTIGGKVQFLDSSFKPAWGGTLQSYTQPDSVTSVMTFNEAPPAWITSGTIANALDWLPDSVTITNSKFINTGRYGTILKASNAVIDNVQYKYNANAGLVLGSSNSAQFKESASPWNVIVRNSAFEDNKGRLAAGGQGLLIDQLQMSGAGINGNMYLYNNSFTNEYKGMVIRDADQVNTWSNTFSSNTTDTVIDPNTTTNIGSQNPAVLKVDSESLGGIYYNQSWGRQTNAGDYRGTIRWTNATGNFAEFTFTGDRIAYYARKGAYMGEVNVYLDGTLVAQNVDLYNSSALTQQKIYENLSLPHGTHTIRVENVGTKNAAALDSYVDIDAFEYGTP